MHQYRISGRPPPMHTQSRSGSEDYISACQEHTRMPRCGRWMPAFRSRRSLALQEQLNRLDIDDLDEVIERELVLLRVVDPPWPFPLHYPLAPLDPLDYPDRVARRIGREVLS